jgi:hypothetical protein
VLEADPQLSTEQAELCACSRPQPPPSSQPPTTTTPPLLRPLSIERRQLTVRHYLSQAIDSSIFTTQAHHHQIALKQFTCTANDLSSVCPCFHLDSLSLALLLALTYFRLSRSINFHLLSGTSGSHLDDQFVHSLTIAIAVKAISNALLQLTITIISLIVSKAFSLSLSLSLLSLYFVGLSSGLLYPTAHSNGLVPLLSLSLSLSLFDSVSLVAQFSRFWTLNQVVSLLETTKKSLFANHNQHSLLLSLSLYHSLYHSLSIIHHGSHHQHN